MNERVVVRARRSVVAALALGAFLMLTACAGGETAEQPAETGDPGEPRTGGTLIYGLSSETNSWNPTIGQWAEPGYAVANAVFDTLIGLDENLDPRPVLAESMEPNDDYSVWTIRVRPDIVFHNGEPLDAQAVKLTLDAFRQSPLTESGTEPITDVVVLDEMTLEIQLDGPWVQLPIAFTGQLGVVMAPEMVNDPDGGSRPIGTGPFEFVDWEPDNRLTVRRNDSYWNGPVYLDGIEFRVITDNTARLDTLETGDLDVAQVGLTATALARAMEIDAGGEFRLYTAQQGEDAELAFLFNTDQPPLDDIRVREALVRGADRRAILEVAGAGLYEQADGIYPPSSPWYVETDYPDYDPDRARQLIEEYEADTGEPVSITLQMPAIASTQLLEQMLQEQWRSIGVDVDIETLEFTQHILSVVTGDYDVAAFNFYAFQHPDGEYPFLHSSGAPPLGEVGVNFTRNRNPAIDAALEEARTTDDIDRQRELYGTVQREMASDLSHLFLWHNKEAIIASPEVIGLDIWTLPDGAPGPGLLQTRHQMAQIWLADPGSNQD